MEKKKPGELRSFVENLNYAVSFGMSMSYIVYTLTKSLPTKT